jgi:hypothetical protein
MLEQHTHSEEQIAACTLIWNLSFDRDVRKNYADHQQLQRILTTIAQTSSNDELRRCASGCLCTLMGGPQPNTLKTSSSPANDPERKDIMISYNHDVKQISKQIKDHLAADGYNVWSKNMVIYHWFNKQFNSHTLILVDQENMHGNLLDAMSNAIENSTIFLMCLTEKYKDSPSCRLGMII